MAVYGYLRRFFQVCYVTNDLARAREVLAERHGVLRMQVLTDMEMPSEPGTVVDLGGAFVGDTMVELIHPKSGRGTLYHDWVAEDRFQLRLHHLGHLIKDADEWAALCVAIEHGREKVASKGHFGDLLEYVYVDTRESLGHYLEYVYCKPAGEAFFAAMPRN